MKKEAIPKILINLPGILVSPKILEDCLLEKNSFKGKLYKEWLNYNYRLELSEINPEEHFKKIKITKEGLFTDVDIEDIKRILSKLFNLNLNSSNVDAEIDKLKDTLTTIKKEGESKDLKSISQSLYEEYRTYRKNILPPHHTFSGGAHQGNELLVGFCNLQIKNLKDLKKYIRDNFSQINYCDNILKLIDEKKLALRLAYLMRSKNEKEPSHQILDYLKKYIKRNKYNLIIDYSFEIDNKRYSIYEIYEYIQRKSNPSTKANQTVTNFLDTNLTSINEVLSKYYKLDLDGETNIDNLEFLKRKITYYESLAVAEIKIGLSNFVGHIYFCLEDGTIILDRFFEDTANGKVAQNQNIYYINKNNFTDFANLSPEQYPEAVMNGKIRIMKPNYKNLENNDDE